MSAATSPADLPAGRWLRAIRRRRTLSQRELADLADVPASTISAVEAGRRSPSVAVLSRIVHAAGFRIALTDADGDALDLDDAHDAVRDRSGRRFPAHLVWGKPPGYLDPGRPWWGWDHLRWQELSDIDVPELTFWHRPRPPREGEWREHPWFGWYQSRPSEGPPEPPPA